MTPPAEHAGRWSRYGLITTLVVVAGALCLRKPGVFVQPQFWAEDASIFYSQAMLDGRAAVFRPYNGYLHLVPRLTAALAAAGNPLYAPTVFLATSVLLTLAVAAACFSPRLHLPYPPLWALAIVLVPHTGEVFNNLTNLQWILALGLLLLLLAEDARTPWQWGADLGSIILLGLTGLFVVLWLPLVGWRFRRRRTLASGVLAGLAAVFAGIQIAALVAHPAPQLPGLSPWADWLRQPCQRLAGSLFMPAAFAEHTPFVFMAGVGMAWFGGMVWLAATAPSPREHRWMMLAAAALIVAGVLYKFRGDLGQIRPIGNGDRYFYLPKVILLWSLVCELNGGGWRRWLSGALLSLSLLISTTGFQAAANVDYHWPRFAARIRVGDPVTVPINPPGWTMSFPRRR